MTVRKLEELKEQIDVLGAEIEKMEEHVQNVKSDARAIFKEKIAELKERKVLALERYARLKEAGEDSAGYLQQGFTAAWEDITNGIKAAKNAFRGMV